MTPSSIDLHFAAEVSCRYHRRRAAFLHGFDSTVNWLTLISSGSAFIFLIGGEVQAAAKYCIAVVSILSVTQIGFRVGKSAAAHANWYSRWCQLLLQIQQKPNPKKADIDEWLAIRKKIEAEHFDELRSLEVDCRNQAIAALNLDHAEIRRIAWWQKPFLHVLSVQQTFPKLHKKK